MKLVDRISSFWRPFRNAGYTSSNNYYGGFTSLGINPSTHTYRRGIFDNSISSSAYCKIAVDCSSIKVLHARINDEDKVEAVIDDELNFALTMSANLDQTGKSLIEDAVLRLLEDGVVALVPTETDEDPLTTESYKIKEIRCGKIVRWFPKEVDVEIYNPESGGLETLRLSKSMVAIVENPFYAIMNEGNSLAKRLQTVLAQLDRTNEENSGGKIDLLIQFPYSSRSNARRKMADSRRQEIESQLTGSKYGIAWIDSSEKVIQLNRAVENNLWEQSIELENKLFTILGISQDVLNGTASEEVMLNYFNRTIEPIMSAITEEMTRKWLSKTAITQKQRVSYYRDPFKFVPISKIANMLISSKMNEQAARTEEAENAEKAAIPEEEEES